MKASAMAPPLLVLLLLLFRPGPSEAAPDAPCNRNKTLVDVQDCRPAVDIKNGTGKPSSACCAKLKNVKVPCLCALLDDNPPKGIDLSKAARLPVLCGFAGPESC